MDKRIICDLCANEFSIKAVDIKEEDVTIKGKQLSTLYFCCPYCKRVYIIQVVDEKAKALQKRYENVVRKNPPLGTIMYANMLAKRRRLKEVLDNLKETYGNEIIMYLTQSRN